MSSFDYRFICDETGFKRWRSQGMYRWDGCLVIQEAWDPRPQYLETPNSTDMIAVPDSRPEQPNVYVNPLPSDLNNVPNF